MHDRSPRCRGSDHGAHDGRADSMIRSSFVLLAELAILFLGVAFAVQLLQRWLGPARLRAWMGGRPVVSALKGIAVGFATPFCTYSAVPVLVGLRRAGVPPAGYVAFIVAAPVLDPVLLGALVLIVGAPVAVAYGLVAFGAAMVLGLVAQRSRIERLLYPGAELVRVGLSGRSQSDLGAVCDSGGSTWVGLRRESAAALNAAARLMRSLGPLLVAGVAIGLAIEAFVSPDIAARVTGDNPIAAIPIASAVGTPLYFSTELFVPIAHSLRGAGVGVGAIVALTIAGAGANLPEFVILSRFARPRAIAVFLGHVFGVAIVGGFIAQALAT